jgi:hypothetical protein
MNKKALAVAVAAALTAPMAAQAVSTNWYGHINRAMQFVDDGTDYDIKFVDPTAYSSRMCWTGTAEASNGVTAGAKIEYDFRSNTIYGGGAGINAGDATDTNLRIRHAFVWFSGDWGKLSLGQTSDATDGVAYAAHNSAWEGTELGHDWGITGFRLSGTGNANEQATVGTAYSFSSSFDGGRRDLVRYDTPSFGPVSAAVSIGTNSRFDTSLSLASDVGGGSLKAKIGYSEAGGSTAASDGAAGGADETILGSASYKFSQGTFIDGFYGTRDFNAGAARSDADTWYIALGHSWGTNTIAVDYMEGNDVTQDCSGDRIGVGFKHGISGTGATLYTGYHHYTADCSAGAAALTVGAGTPAAVTGTGIQDVDEFHVGARVHFD